MYSKNVTKTLIMITIINSFDQSDYHEYHDKLKSLCIIDS